MTVSDAHDLLKGSLAKDKNEILFSSYGINYSKIEEVYKKGTIFIRMSGLSDNKKK